MSTEEQHKRRRIYVLETHHHEVEKVVHMMTVDEDITIEVVGLGSGEMTFRVTGAALFERMVLEGSFDAVSLDDAFAEAAKNMDIKPDAAGFYRGTDLGVAITWAEPKTLANLITDIIRNQ